MSEELRERVQKLLALAKGGVGGEAVNARRMLEKLLKKTGFRLEDMESERKDVHYYGYKNEQEAVLLYQILVAVMGRKADIRVNAKRKKFVVLVTVAQGVEIEMFWSVHKKQYAKEQMTFLKAYVHRHRLFPKDDADDDDETPELTPEQVAEIERMRMIMRGMETVVVRKQIGGAG
jgi:hypothetical protein